MKFLLFLLGSSFSWCLISQRVDFLTPELITGHPGKTGMFSCKLDGDSIVYEMKQGKLTGEFKRYQAREKKSEGQLLNHRRVGTWKFRKDKAKLIFEFHPRGFVLLKKLSGVRGSRVWWGRGRVHYAYSIRMNEEFSAEVEGRSKIRFGTREGYVIEYYRGSQKPYATMRFHQGLYDGKREIFYPNGLPAMRAEFQAGAVKGELLHYSLNGLVVTRQYGNENKNLFIDPSEIIRSETFYIYVDTTFADSLFRSQQGSWTPKLNSWFELNELATYADDMNTKIYYATSSKPDISGLEPSVGSYKNVRGWVVRYKSLFLAQVWQHYEVPMALQCISEVKSDTGISYYAGPWIYLPTLYQTHPETAQLFTALQRLNFPFLYLTKKEGEFVFDEHGWAKKLVREENDWWDLFQSR